MTISRSRPRPDMMIRDPDGYPVAVVEMQNLPNLSRDMATQIRHNLLEYGIPIRTPYFLLLSQDVGFLWKDAKPTDLDIPPTYEFPMNNVVDRYLKGGSEQRLYRSIFELIVFQWLSDLAIYPGNEHEEPEKTLTLAGFRESIKDATILTEENI